MPCDISARGGNVQLVLAENGAQLCKQFRRIGHEHHHFQRFQLGVDLNVGLRLVFTADELAHVPQNVLLLMPHPIRWPEYVPQAALLALVITHVVEQRERGLLAAAGGNALIAAQAR